MELLHTFFQKIPMAALFISIAIGYAVGKLKIGNFQLGGMAGTLLVAVIIGQIGVPVDPVAWDAPSNPGYSGPCVRSSSACLHFCAPKRSPMVTS